MEEIEIPEAIRESVELPEQSRLSLMPLIFGIIFCLGVTGLLARWLVPVINKPARQSVNDFVAKPVAPQPKNPPKQEKKTSTLKPIPPTPKKIDLLGHLPYSVAPESELASVTNDGGLRMRSPAADKFRQMQADARAEGIILTPISAFRDDQAQEQLFFGVKEQRRQDAARRAKVSAPPGYSEHHTGYAVDIGDGNVPATNLEEEFANTPAFRWLEKNASRYSFELSFPRNNKQGVSYEPWHWRFVGDRNSLETFYKVRN